MNKRIRKKQKTMALKKAKKMVRKSKQKYGSDSEEYQMACFLYAMRKFCGFDLTKALNRMSKKLKQMAKKAFAIKNTILEAEEKGSLI